MKTTSTTSTKTVKATETKNPKPQTTIDQSKFVTSIGTHGGTYGRPF